jgi:hypothetical protein
MNLSVCPFCGEYPVFKEYRNGFGRHLFGIQCKNTNCEIKPRVQKVQKKAVVSAWEKRAPVSINLSASVQQPAARNGLENNICEAATAGDLAAPENNSMAASA